MNDLPEDEIPPNITYVTRSDQDFPVTCNDDEVSIPAFDFINTPFHEEHDCKINITCDVKNFGFELQNDQYTNWPCICSIAQSTSAATICKSIKAARHKYVGAFIVAIDNTPDVRKAIQNKRNLLTGFRNHSDNCYDIPLINTGLQSNPVLPTTHAGIYGQHKEHIQNMER